MRLVARRWIKIPSAKQAEVASATAAVAADDYDRPIVTVNRTGSP